MAKISQIDQDLIRTIAELVNEANLAEIELEQDDFRIRVTRTLPAREVVHVGQPAPSYAPQPQAAPAQPAAAPAQNAAPAPAAPEDLAGNPATLTSPMVGTAYMAAEPGAKAFVEIGDSVSEGETVMIVEAMKTMNQIPAHKSGKITRILVADATPVEYGEPLMVIE